MPGRKWVSFPYEREEFRLDGPKLKKRWAALHRGDCEPFPTSTGLQDAWRAFHAGDFGAAVEAGSKLGVPGAVVAGKAAGVYATYLEKSASQAVAVLEEAVARCEAAAAALPDHPNAHYMLAFVLGRLSQRISIVKALAAGHATRVRSCLDRTLALEPKHADAHIALGTYHAEIVARVGGLAASLTYGATKTKAIEHFEKALKLAPESAIARVEYAAALRLLDPRGSKARAVELEREAATLRPGDAMEKLDVERAKASAD